MTAETPHPGKEGEPPCGRRLIQWDLRTVFLLTAAVAVWLAYFLCSNGVARFKEQIPLMQAVAPELVVEDPQRIAVLSLPPIAMRGWRWDVYLPDGEHWLRLATRDIPRDGLPSPVGQVRLPEGRHRIALKLSRNPGGARLAVLVDGDIAVDAREGPKWAAPREYEWGVKKELPAMEPVVLYRGGYRTNTSPRDDSLLLWIEPARGDGGMTNEEIQMTKQVRRSE